MKTKHFFILFLIIFFSLSIFNISLASEITFSPISNTIRNGELVKINLYINAGEDRINAVEGKLIFPSNLLSVSNINFGNSVLNFWVEQPHAENDGVIIFSGVTPGGFGGNNNNLLFSVIFKGKSEGSAELTVKDAVALKDDGAGTRSDLKLGKGSIKIITKSDGVSSSSSTKISEEINPSNDHEPPESFTPLIGNNPDIFGGKYFLVFMTTDKQSGIDHYEVQESRSKSVKDDAWINAESPYKLLDQELHSFAFVRAIDKAQNVREETLSPLYPQKFYQSVKFWVIITLVLLVFLFVKKRKFAYFSK